MFLVLQSHKIVDGKIHFNVPQHVFDDKPVLEFRITHLYISFTKSSSKISTQNDLISLQSNLIDKTPFNPRQDLIFLSVSDSFDYVDYKPTHFLRYKLRLRDLNDSEFFLHSNNTQLLERIYFVSLQLEIVPYGWI